MKIYKNEVGLQWLHDITYQYNFPEGYHHVIRGQGYWLSPVIHYVGEVGFCYYKDDDSKWRRYYPKRKKRGSGSIASG